MNNATVVGVDASGGFWRYLAQASAARPGAIALLNDRISVTYRKFFDDVEAEAAGLIRLGVSRGERVGLAAGNTYQWIISYFALARVGAVSVLLNTRWTAGEFAYALTSCSLDTVLFEPSIRSRPIAAILTEAVASHPVRLVPLLRVGDAPPDAGHLDGFYAPGQAEDSVLAEISLRSESLRERDLATMIFTSGSTGFPKAAMLRHGGLVRNALAHTARLGVGHADRWCSAMPFFHLGGSIWGLLGTLVRGSTLVFLEKFDPEKCLWAIDHFRATVHFAVATMMYDELRVPAFGRYDLRSLRVCSAGAAQALRREVRAKYGVPAILSMWGQTEAHGNVSVTGPFDPVWAQDDTFGRPHEGIQIVAVEPDSGRPLDPGCEGELLVRGWCVFDGYFGNQEATDRIIDGSGWLHTGDLGAVRKDGYVIFTGRADEKIRVGGENVSLTEIEDVIVGHPEVEQCYAVSIADSRLEQVPVAFIRPKPDSSLTEHDIKDYCRLHLAQFKLPSRIILVSELPQGASGRVSKAMLRDQVIREGGE